MADSTQTTDTNILRDEIQDLLIDAYGELNITCYERALSILEAAIDALKRILVLRSAE